MSKQLVKAWLADPNRTFEDGLKLYNQHKRDSSRDAFFNSQPTFKPGTIQFNILLTELTRIGRILDQLPDPKPEEVIPSKPIRLGSPMSAAERKASALKIENFDSKIDYNSLPDDMKAKFDRIRELSKTIGGLKTAMDAATENDERKNFAEQLLSSWDERKSLWDELDAWNENQQPNKKSIQPKADFAEMSITQLKKERKTRLDNINRANKNAKNKQKAKQAIEEWSSEIETIERLIESKQSNG